MSGYLELEGKRARTIVSKVVRQGSDMSGLLVIRQPY